MTKSAATIVEEVASPGDVYTMAEAARLKGVSYHTVSRAVRRNKLPATRLGRMALITAEDLRDWRPMRERAPRKYRRREPNPDAAPAMLDLASGERVELASRMSILFEILHGSASDLPVAEFLALLADRFGSALDLKRVVIWGVDEKTEKVRRLASFGPALSMLPASHAYAPSKAFAEALAAGEPTVLTAKVVGGERAKDFVNASSLLVVPMSVGSDLVGYILADRAGDDLDLEPAEEIFAKGLANQAALLLERAEMRDRERLRNEQLTAILDNISEAVLAADAEGNMTLANAAARAHYGIEEEGLEPTEELKVLWASAKRKSPEGKAIPFGETPLRKAATSGTKVENLNFTVSFPGGREVSLRTSAHPIYAEKGQLIGAVSISEEIAASKKSPKR